MSDNPVERSLSTLEQNCRRPGSWLIEGFSVVRMPGGRWRILNPPARITSRLTFSTLGEAREWIVDELNEIPH